MRACVCGWHSAKFITVEERVSERAIKLSPLPPA